jgi:hypothetical protein
MTVSVRHVQDVASAETSLGAADTSVCATSGWRTYFLTGP